MSRALRREEGLDEQGTSSGIAGEHVLLNAYEHSAGIILAVGSFLSISRHVEYHRALAVLLVFCTDVVLREERSAALLLQAIARPKACKFSSECGSTNHASSLPHRRKGQTPSVVLFVNVLETLRYLTNVLVFDVVKGIAVLWTRVYLILPLSTVKDFGAVRDWN